MKIGLFAFFKMLYVKCCNASILLNIEIKKLINTLFFICVKAEDKILLNTWMMQCCNSVKHYNWGDDINYYFIRELTGKRIFNNQNLYPFIGIKGGKNYLTIGSIIEAYSTKNSIIWGSGALYGNKKLKELPLKVLAVRGPLTRRYLLQNGVQCPEVYGDPALLISRFYKPIVKKKYKLGIIPHYVDLSNKFIKELLVNYSDDIILINMQDYKDWHDIVDLINSCDMIISSSLHGLIVSDSYDIPNVWVTFSDKVLGGKFKFHDYFLSVHRRLSDPFEIKSSLSLEFLLALRDSWEPIHFDSNPLLAACPFKIVLT